MMPPEITPLLQFLRIELGIPEATIRFILRRLAREQGPLPVILWRYGLIPIEQIPRLFEWCAGLETPIPLTWRLDP
ncbi:MAG: DUF2949 domain-containing protein [Thermostichus sp. DG02_5_bins_236]